jgi:hypothetical protein
MSKKPNAKKSLWLVVPAIALMCAGSAWAQCTVTRSQIEDAIKAGATGDDLYNQYGSCTSSDTPTGTASQFPQGSQSVPRAIGNKLNTFVNFNINWERIEACGYHPQRQEADCAIEILRNTGYGGPICVGPGSFEWVELCVNFGAGLVPVGIGQVHVHDAAGQLPPWDFGVVVQGNPQIAGRLKNGATFPARAILSWAIIPPANCNWAPVFGNWANFRLRLDP